MADYTIDQWLPGMVDYNVPDGTVMAILFNNGVASGAPVSEVGQRERDLCLADLYMWLASSSSSSTGEYVSDGGWQHQKAAKNVVDRAELLRALHDEALTTARRLMREEGILGGISSGANVAAALKLAADPKYAGKRIVTIICDLADRYISTALFTS